MSTINSFAGDHAFLSNFYPVPIFIEGPDNRIFEFPSVEHAYQASKTEDISDFEKFCDVNLSAGQAKKLGRKVSMRSDWNQIKLKVMEILVFQKFENNLDLGLMLLDTGDAELIEGNWWGDDFWGDDFWGVCTEAGQNHLGKILMRCRDRLRFEDFYS